MPHNIALSSEKKDRHVERLPCLPLGVCCPFTQAHSHLLPQCLLLLSNLFIIFIPHFSVDIKTQSSLQLKCTQKLQLLNVKPQNLQVQVLPSWRVKKEDFGHAPCHLCVCENLTTIAFQLLPESCQGRPLFQLIFDL